MGDAPKIPFNSSAVRANVSKETTCYCAWEWSAAMEQWVLTFADRNIDAAVAWVRALRVEFWELREPVFGIAFDASEKQRERLNREKAARTKGGDRGKR